MSFEKNLRSQIPMSEAAAYFLSMKKFGEALPPDTSGQLEGQFAAQLPEVLQAMGAIVENEFKTLLAYKVYAESLRGLCHEGIAEEFEEHAQNELEHAEYILRRMSVLGGPVQIPDIPAPMASCVPEEIIQTMIQMEQEGIAKWQALHAMMGENPTKYEIESFLVREQHHLDELWQLVPHEAQPQEMGAPGAPPPEAQAPAPGQAGPAGASVKVDVKPGAGEKVAFAEKMMKGTEHYYSDRMREVLQGLPAKVYTPEGAMEGIKQAGITELDRAQKTIPPKNVSTKTTAEGPENEEKMAALRMKLALQEMMEAPMDPAPPQQSGMGGPQMSGPDPTTTAYLQSEQQGRAAEEQSAANYFKTQLDQTKQELQTTQAAQQQVEQQAQELQQQVAMSQNAIAAAQNSAQQATGLAMQQITEQGDKALQSQMESAQMRAAYQQLRGSMMDLATQEPPPSALQQQPGSPPGAMAPGLPGDTGQRNPSNEGPAGQAQPAESAPANVPPGGDQNNAGPQEPTQGGTEGTAKGQGATSVTVKQGAPRGLIGAGVGAGLGALGGAEMGRHADELRGKVKELEGAQGGFGKALQLMKNKALLGAAELSEKSPTSGALVGSLLGAGVGRATEPAVRSVLERFRPAGH